MTKYGNRKTEKDGMIFDSKAEAAYYEQLKLRKYAGEIGEIRLQPCYPIVVNGTLIAKYYADFAYEDFTTQETFVDDVKSAPTRTAVYRLKKKLVESLYGIKIREIIT